jgi:hypothetical protein
MKRVYRRNILKRSFKSDRSDIDSTVDISSTALEEWDTFKRLSSVRCKAPNFKKVASMVKVTLRQYDVIAEDP